MKVEQEPDHIDTRRILRAAFVGFVGLAAGIAAAVLLLHGTPAPIASPPVDASLIVATENGITLRTERRESLEHYGWVDRDAGIAKIPIERAIDLMAADAGR